MNSSRTIPRLVNRSWSGSPLQINNSTSQISFAGRAVTDAGPALSNQSIYRSTNCSAKGPSIPRRAFHATARRQMSSSSIPHSAIPHISLHIAASSSGKGMKFQPEKSTYDFHPDNPLGVQKGDTVFQRRRARPDSGEDSYFVTRVGGNTTATAFGVCDGVGGWSDHGINPADFSHGLCGYMTDIASQWPRDAESQDDQLGPKKLMEYAYEYTLKDRQIRAGGSTACVGITDDDGRMKIANLGDSGFLQLRAGTVHHYSNPQTHAFNTPFQMSMTPPEIMSQMQIFGGVPLNDPPHRADLADHTLRHGDVLVLATDGVWDNLSSQDVLNTVSRVMRELGAWERTSDRGFVVTDKIGTLTTDGMDYMGKVRTLQNIVASIIVGEAKVASHDKKRDGPFARAVQKEYPNERFRGGKVDDITALVVIPIEDGKAQEQSLKAKL